MFFSQPNRYAVLIGTVLCLWSTWDWFVSEVKERCPTTAILSPVALSPKERYFYYINLANHCCYRKHDRESAAQYADLALKNRVVADSFNTEEVFASTLIALGKYEQAKCLILSLAPKKKSPKYCLAPMVAYRQDLLGQACMGLHQYQSAAKIFAKDIPDLIPENTVRSTLELRLFIADVCLGDNRAAKIALKQLRQNTYMLGQPFQTEAECCPLIALYEPLINLSSEDAKEAKNICDKHIRFWQKSEYLGDPDAVPMLEGAAKVLQDRGFSTESGRLMTCAERLKREHSIN